MSASFWSSSHCNNWLLSRQKVALSQQDDLQIVKMEELRQLRLHYISVLQSAAKMLQLRQQVLATAIVYFRRFYVSNSFHVCDPMLVGPTCIYLACKVEECPVIQASAMIEKFKQSPENVFKRYQYTPENILECEYYLLEEFDCYLIVYHPYRPLTQYMRDLKLEQHQLQAAWNIVNDSYHTDVCLLYPPYLTALAALFMAVVHTEDNAASASNAAATSASLGDSSSSSAAAGSATGAEDGRPPQAVAVVTSITNASSSKLADLRRWFSELNVDMDEIIEISQHLLDFYAFYTQQFNNTERSSQMSELLRRIRETVVPAPQPPPPGQTSPFVLGSSNSTPVSY